MARLRSVTLARGYHAGMKRTTIAAPDDVMDRLRAIAVQRNVSLATVIREALEEKAASQRPLPKSLGMGASGYTDTARRTAEEGFVGEPWR